MSTILVVDDILVVEFCCFVLAGMEGANLLRASDEFEAIEQARNYRHRIDLLLSDIHLMTGSLCGLQLAERVQTLRPRVNVLLMSECAADEALLRPGWQFMLKPFHPWALLQKVQLAVDQSCRKESRNILKHI